jgi:TIR domain
MAHDVFISHSTNNRPVANAVCAALEREGIRCWIAPRDVMPGRSYSGEITRAIQQSRAFVLIFSEHSNSSEQVLREVQLAANSRLHIIQFRIDPVVPSEDLEYYLSGPHWLDAVTPPLENHIEQLRTSVKALLALPRAGEADGAAPPRAPRPGSVAEPLEETRPTRQAVATAPLPIAVTPSTNIWKWVALAAVAVTVFGGVALFLIFGQAKSKPAATIAEPSTNIIPVPPPPPAPVQQNANAESNRVVQQSIAPPPATALVSAAETERYARAFYREMERGDVSKAALYLDETVDYYSFGPKDKAFVTEQMRQFVAALSVRSFEVGDVKVQDSSKPIIATVIFDVRYSARDVVGNAGTGHTRVEWDLAKRADGLKIVRSNWMTYPDPTPSR